MSSCRSRCASKLRLARHIPLHFRFIQQFLMRNASLHVSLPSLCFLNFSNVTADLFFDMIFETSRTTAMRVSHKPLWRATHQDSQNSVSPLSRRNCASCSYCTLQQKPSTFRFKKALFCQNPTWSSTPFHSHHATCSNLPLGKVPQNIPHNMNPNFIAAVTLGWNWKCSVPQASRRHGLVTSHNEILAEPGLAVPQCFRVEHDIAQIVCLLVRCTPSLLDQRCCDSSVLERHSPQAILEAPKSFTEACRPLCSPCRMCKQLPREKTVFVLLVAGVARLRRLSTKDCIHFTSIPEKDPDAALDTTQVLFRSPVVFLPLSRTMFQSSRIQTEFPWFWQSFRNLSSISINILLSQFYHFPAVTLDQTMRFMSPATSAVVACRNSVHSTFPWFLIRSASSWL